MQVTYVDHMGSDLSVVNAARVSFSKTSELEEYTDPNDPKPTVYKRLSEKDVRLIQFLARNNHWTPFGHTSVTLHIAAPIFIARQLGKHQIGLVWNEVSRRYVDDEPEFFMPEAWRKRPENGIKQGSSDDVVETENVLKVGELFELCGGVYQDLIESGVAPEQARMVLPQSMYTEWYWTGSLAAFARVYNLRIDPHAQREVQEIARQINEVIEPLYPESWRSMIERAQ